MILGDPLRMSYDPSGGVARLPKPAAVTVTPDGMDFTGTHSAVVDAVSYEWRRIGTTTTAWAATAALAFEGTVDVDGTFAVQVRAVDAEGVRGFAKTSATWEVGADDDTRVTSTGDIRVTSAGDTRVTA